MIKDIHVIDGWYNKPSKEIILKHNTGGKVYISVDKLDSHNEFTWYVLGEQQLEQEDPIITPDPQDPDTPEVDTPTYYTVSIALAEHGTVTVSGLTNGKVLEGRAITIETQPEDGYNLYSLKVVMNDGTNLLLYRNNINRYTYLIYNNIQIVAGFKADEVPVPDDPEIPDTPQDPDFPIPTYVDLGLSVYWASWNVGENAPSGNTKRYGWGDATGTVNTEVQKDYTESLSYSITSIAGMADYDIARRQYGSNWRMPTLAEFLELYDETKIIRESVKINGVTGVKFTSKADPTKYIFLPGCGMQHPSNGLLQYDGSCYYWTATGSYATNTGWLGLMVWAMEGVLDTSYKYDVCWHVPIRAVKIKNGSTPDEPTTNLTFPKPSAAVDLGLSVDWSPWNIGGSSATDNTHLYGWGDPTGTVTSKSIGDYAIGLPETSDANIAGNANYDIAAKQWGDGWRMPTLDEITELYNGCNVTLTSINGIAIYKFESKLDSSKYIVFPLISNIRGNIDTTDDRPYIWSANGVSVDGKLRGVFAQMLPSSFDRTPWYRYYGFAIRPVKDKQGSNPSEGQQEQPAGEGATQHFTFVDLGLPNHTKWATCNVGAENPPDFGAYYAYGCTEETTDFSQSNYPYYVNGAYQIPGGGNICGNVNYDAAAKVSGGIAQTPTKDQIKELIDNCTWEWKEHYNGSCTNGYLVTGPNGNSIFMPACGHYGVYMLSGQSELNGTNITGYYWSGEVVDSVANLFSTYGNAYCLVTGQPEENTQTVSLPGTVAHSGCCIRPVAANNNIATVGAAVDLGLSNGTLWSDRNIGATKDSDYGGYFQWGDINSHTDGFGEQDYQYYNSSTNTYTDIAGVICGDARYDAATYNWGSLWTIPSKDDFHWLIDKCTWTWTLKNGINGYQITGTNGNSIFLPACGSRTELGLDADNRQGNYWSGTVWSNNSERNMAWELIFESNYKDPGYLGRSVGCCIRPVMKTLN